MNQRLPRIISSRRIIFFITTVAIAIAAFAAGVSVGSYTQLSPWTMPPTADVDTAYVESVTKLFDEVKQDVAEIRGLQPPSDAQVKIVPLEWYRNTWGEQYVESNAEELMVQQRIYRALLLLPPTEQLKDVKIQWAANVAAATLDDNVWVIRENFNLDSLSQGRAILAHEMVHILQNTHLTRLSPSTFDEQLAARALIEGDADYTTKLYFAEKKETLPVARQPQVDSTATLTNPLLALEYFPYLYGEAFVEVLSQHGGWAQVNSAYENPPTTTEQVMHPMKYLMGETAVDVEIPQAENGNWTLIKTDSQGEYFIQVMLNAHVAASEAKAAAEGWGGDRLAYYTKQDAYLVAWKTVWDTPNDALEFHSTFNAAVKAAGGEELNSGLWKTTEGFITVKLQDRTVTIYALGAK